MELRELQEFTELERQCEKETIYSLKKVNFENYFTIFVLKIELQELQEFTELERQCETETIDSLKKVNFEICFTIFVLKIDQELQEFKEFK